MVPGHVPMVLSAVRLHDQRMRHYTRRPHVGCGPPTDPESLELYARTTAPFGLQVWQGSRLPQNASMSQQQRLPSARGACPIKPLTMSLRASVTSWLVLRPLMMMAVLAFSWTCGSRLRLARSALALPCFGMMFLDGMAAQGVISCSQTLSLRAEAGQAWDREGAGEEKKKTRRKSRGLADRYLCFVPDPWAHGSTD